MTAEASGKGIIWILVTCNDVEEATRIGDAVLAERRATCFDVFPRTLARYFWPPKSGKVEEAAGALLVFETFDSSFDAVAALVRTHHADQLPFIGALRIDHVAPAYSDWMDNELRPID